MCTYPTLHDLLHNFLEGTVREISRSGKVCSETVEEGVPTLATLAETVIMSLLVTAAMWCVSPLSGQVRSK